MNKVIIANFRHRSINPPFPLTKKMKFEFHCSSQQFPTGEYFGYTTVENETVLTPVGYQTSELAVNAAVKQAKTFIPTMERIGYKLVSTILKDE